MSNAGPISKNEPARIGIVTVSDRASRGEYEDRGGPAIRQYLDKQIQITGLQQIIQTMFESGLKARPGSE